jgi:hypothetical protein
MKCRNHKEILFQAWPGIFICVTCHYEAMKKCEQKLSLRSTPGKQESTETSICTKSQLKPEK